MQPILIFHSYLVRRKSPAQTSFSRINCGDSDTIHLERPPNKTAALQSFAARLLWLDKGYAGSADSTYMTINRMEMMYMNAGTSLPLPRISLIRE